MNKRYIDFVPARSARSATAKKPKDPVVFVQKREVNEIEIDRIFEAKNEKKPAGVTIRKDDKKLDIPKVHFVNTEKVSKRPLSENVVYKKKIIVSEEEKLSKPVTIIEKPEKDSKMSMVVAIIITIILGAAAGTVAFLLLPN